MPSGSVSSSKEVSLKPSRIIPPGPEIDGGLQRWTEAMRHSGSLIQEFLFSEYPTYLP